MVSEKIISYDKLSLCCASFCISVFAFLGKDTISIIMSNFVFMVFILAALLFCIGKRFRSKSFIVFLICLFAYIGSAYAIVSKSVNYIPAEQLLAEYEGIECTLEAEITRISSFGNNYSVYDAKLLKINDNVPDAPFGTEPKIRISSFGEDLLSTGNTVSFSAVLERPVNTLDDGFKFRKYLESKTIFLSCTLQGDFTVISQGKPGTISKIQEKLRLGFMKYIGNGHQGYKDGISSCMLFGDKSGIDDYLEDIFRGSGLSHILSVSGLHLSILFGVVMGLLGASKNKRKRRRFPLSELVSCAVAFTYMVFSGFTPSIMRAGFMLICANIMSLISYYYRKLRGAGMPDTLTEYTSLSSLFGSLFIICLISPYSVYDIGLQLSFMSSLGIILVMPLYDEIKGKVKPKFLNYIISPIVVTLSAISFTFPIMAYSFGTFSSVSVFSNLAVAFIATPYLALLLFLAIFILLPTGIITHIICGILGSICSFLATLLLEIAEYFSSFRFSVIDMNFDIGIFIVFFSCVMLSVFASVFKMQNVIKTLCSIILALLVFSFSNGFATTVVSFYTPTLRACTLSKLPYAMLSVEDTRITFDFGEGLSKISQNRELLGKSYYETNNIYVVVPKEASKFEDIYYNILFFERYCDIDVLLLPGKNAIENVNVDENTYREFVTKLYDSGGYEFAFYEKNIEVSDMKIELSLGRENTEIYAENFAIVSSDKYDEALSVRASERAENTVYFCNSAKDTEKGERKQKTKLYVSSHCVKYVKDAEKIQTQSIMEIR